MTRCGKRIMRTSYLRDSEGQMTGETKQVDTPGLSYSCDIMIDDSPHEGPCASPSDPHSVAMRRKWEADNKIRVAAQRHHDSGLGRVQSQPMTVASIIEGPSLVPHPAAPTECPFCDEKPMLKELSQHISYHAMESERREKERPVMAVSNINVISDWVDSIANVVFVPKEVKQAIQALSR